MLVLDRQFLPHETIWAVTQTSFLTSTVLLTKTLHFFFFAGCVCVCVRGMGVGVRVANYHPLQNSLTFP